MWGQIDLGKTDTDSLTYLLYTENMLADFILENRFERVTNWLKFDVIDALTPGALSALAVF